MLYVWVLKTIKCFGTVGYYVINSRIKWIDEKKYIREQEHKVMIHDKLTKKEYVNPFKRSKVINLLELKWRKDSIQMYVV